jgi:hypothetical protein
MTAKAISTILLQEAPFLTHSFKAIDCYDAPLETAGLKHRSENADIMKW